MVIKAALLGAAVATIFAASPLNAAVLYSTLGPGGSYNTNNKYAQDGNTIYQAFLFQPSATAALASITVALAQQTPIANQTQFQLFAGDATNLLTLLESWVVANNAPEPGVLLTMNSVNTPLLTAGAHYWLAITEPDAPNGPNSLWYFNNQGIFGTRRTSFGIALGSGMPAFQVNSPNVDIENQTPEPSAGLVVGLGLALVTFFAKRRAA